MNINDVSTQLLYSTTPLITEKADGTRSIGTGFFFSVPVDGRDGSIPLLVSNLHVLGDMIQGAFRLHRQHDGLPTNEVLNIDFDNTVVIRSQVPELDLAAVPIGPVLNQLEKTGNSYFLRTIDLSLIPTRETFEKLSAIEEVTLIGYPKGVFDRVNQIPVVRRGITATPAWNDFEGRREFLVDAGVFEGSSGSPVFIFNQGAYATSDGITVGSRLYLIGMIKSTYKGSRRTGSYLDLGVAINGEAIRDELERVAKSLS